MVAAISAFVRGSRPSERAKFSLPFCFTGRLREDWLGASGSPKTHGGSCQVTFLTG